VIEVFRLFFGGLNNLLRIALHVMLLKEIFFVKIDISWNGDSYHTKVPVLESLFR
jgi:hypothetical protein